MINGYIVQRRKKMNKADLKSMIFIVMENALNYFSISVGFKGKYKGNYSMSIYHLKPKFHS